MISRLECPFAPLHSDGESHFLPGLCILRWADKWVSWMFTILWVSIWKKPGKVLQWRPALCITGDWLQQYIVLTIVCFCCTSVFVLCLVHWRLMRLCAVHESWDWDEILVFLTDAEALVRGALGSGLGLVMCSGGSRCGLMAILKVFSGPLCTADRLEIRFKKNLHDEEVQ